MSSFKFSTFNTDSKRFPRIPPQTLHACFTEIAKHGLIAGVHNENDEMVRAAMAEVEASGIRDYRAHAMSRPPVTETLAMAEVYEIGAQTGCSAHVVHCSVGRGYDLCESYRRQGFDTTVEACIHYLILDERTMSPVSAARPRSIRRCGRAAKWKHCGIISRQATSRWCRPTT